MPVKPFLVTKKSQVDLFLKCVRKGMSERKSAELAGIRQQTIIDWKHEGELREAAGKGGEDPFVDFIEKLKKARAGFVSDALGNIQAAGAKQWQASAWLLERRCPEDFSPRAEVSVPEAKIQIVSDVKKEGD